MAFQKLNQTGNFAPSRSVLDAAIAVIAFITTAAQEFTLKLGTELPQLGDKVDGLAADLRLTVSNINGDIAATTAVMTALDVNGEPLGEPVNGDFTDIGPDGVVYRQRLSELDPATHSVKLELSEGVEGDDPEKPIAEFTFGVAVD